MLTPHAVLIGLLTGAVWWDIRYRRIPNALIVTGLVLGVVSATLKLGNINFLQAIIGAFIGFGFFIVPYAFGRLGAGDVKLLAMAGLFLGPLATCKAALYAMMAGGGLALFYWAVMQTGKGNAVGIRRKDLPYALAISMGVAVEMLT